MRPGRSSATRLVKLSRNGPKPMVRSATSSVSCWLRMRAATHQGRNSGYRATSATRSKSWSGRYGTICRSLWFGISGGELAQPRLLQRSEIRIGMVGAAGQRGRAHEQEALGAGDRGVFGELVGRDEAVHRGVLHGGLEIL